jgi:hypothetical protein
MYTEWREGWLPGIDLYRVERGLASRQRPIQCGERAGFQAGI